jgi:hypothetical protein
MFRPARIVSFRRHRFVSLDVLIGSELFRRHRFVSLDVLIGSGLFRRRHRFVSLDVLIASVLFRRHRFVSLDVLIDSVLFRAAFCLMGDYLLYRSLARLFNWRDFLNDMFLR